MHMRLSALRKLIFDVYGVQEMFFRLAKKIRSTCLILKPKLQIIFQSKFCVRPWSGHRMIHKPAKK